MSKPIHIRKVIESDFISIYHFINELENFVFDEQELKKAFDRNLGNENIIYLIAEIDHKPIGFISCHIQILLHHGGQKIGEIQEMFVDTNYRKLGVGKKLVDTLKRIAQEIEIDQLEVTSNKKRVEAHKFYQREKFMNTHEKFTFKC